MQQNRPKDSTIAEESAKPSESLDFSLVVDFASQRAAIFLTADVFAAANPVCKRCWNLAGSE